MHCIFAVEYDSHDHGHDLIFILLFYFIYFFGLLSKYLPCAALINLYVYEGILEEHHFHHK